MELRSHIVAGMAVALALASCTSEPTTGHADVPPALAAELADQLEADFEELTGANGLASSMGEAQAARRNGEDRTP